MESEQNKIFIEKFDLERYDFYNLTPFADCNIGFSVLKKLNNNDTNNVTLLKISIHPEILKTENRKKPLSVSATYGEDTRHGVSMRSLKNTKLTDPIDLEYSNYFYNIKTQKLYKNNKEITGNKLIDEVYNKHIKSTEPIKGLFIRIKIKFWRVLMKSIYELMSKLFYYMLFIISGDRYTYEPFLETETLNSKVIKSKYKEVEELEKIEGKAKEELKSGKKFNFFGYEASGWSIIFYSILHLLIYMIFMCYGYKPILLITIFKNNFLTLIYVFFSLFIIEVVIPKFLMLLIRFFSKLSANSLYRKIKL